MPGLAARNQRVPSSRLHRSQRVPSGPFRRAVPRAAQFLEPWGERSQRGYGIEVLERFVRETAYVEFVGPAERRADRLAEMTALAYDDLSADRQTVAAVQALEAEVEAWLARRTTGLGFSEAVLEDRSGR